MDVFFQKLASSVFFNSAPVKKDKPVLLASGSPRSHPVRPTAHCSIQQPNDLPRHRIAHWDKKREKCANCSHIYLKTLSKHPGFCSVDCKSNMVYLEKVNRTIRAMRNTVQEQTKGEKEQQQPQAPEQLQASKEDGLDVVESECKTYAEFGLESRILDASNVEWAFSAMY